MTPWLPFSEFVNLQTQNVWIGLKISERRTVGFHSWELRFCKCKSRPAREHRFQMLWLRRFQVTWFIDIQKCSWAVLWYYDTSFLFWWCIPRKHKSKLIAMVQKMRILNPCPELVAFDEDRTELYLGCETHVDGRQQRVLSWSASLWKTGSYETVEIEINF